MRKLLLLISFLLLAGCATTKPATYTFQKENVYEAAYEKVFTKVISFSDDSKIRLKRAEKDSDAIISEEVKIPYKGFQYKSDYCDCGTLGGLYVYREILGKVNVILKNINDMKTSVEIIAHYRAAKWLGNNFKEWVTCESKGYFEERLFNYLNEAFIKNPEDQSQDPTASYTASN